MAAASSDGSGNGRSGSNDNDNNSDDVSASFTQESQELFHHLDTLQRQMAEAAAREEEEKRYAEEEQIAGAEMSLNKSKSSSNKPLLQALKSISLLTLSASRLLLWNPTATLLLPELSDALQEWYESLTPQTVQLYVRLLPTSLNEIYNVIGTTPKGQEWLSSTQHVQQAVLEMLCTTSTQNVVQNSAVGWVHVIQALNTPHARQALKSVAQVITSWQQALCTDEAQSFVLAVQDSLLKGIATAADARATSAMADLTANLSLALEQTRQDLSDERVLLEEEQRQPQQNESGDTPMSRGPAMNGNPPIPTRERSTAEAALGIPTSGSVVTMDDCNDEGSSFLILFQQKIEEHRQKLPPRRKIRQLRTTTEGNIEEEEDEDEDNSDDAWEPIIKDQGHAGAAHGGNRGTPTSITTTQPKRIRRQSKNSKKQLKIQRYMVYAGCSILVIGIMALAWFVLGLFGLYKLYTGIGHSHIQPAPVIKVVYMMPNGELSTAPPSSFSDHHFFQQHAPFDRVNVQAHHDGGSHLDGPAPLADATKKHVVELKQEL
jgi:hypothetical protein